MYQVLVNIQSSSYSGVNLTSQVLKFDTQEEVEFAINELNNAEDDYKYSFVRLYPHPRKFDVQVEFKHDLSGANRNTFITVIAMDEKDAEQQVRTKVENDGHKVLNVSVYRN